MDVRNIMKVGSLDYQLELIISILLYLQKQVGWKSKYDSPRWEYNPYIAIILFRKWAISWTIGWKDYMQNLATWEAILDYNYYDRPITSQTGWLNIDGNNMILETLKK